MPSKAKPPSRNSFSVRFEVFRGRTPIGTHLLTGPSIRVGSRAVTGLHIKDKSVDSFHAFISVDTLGRVLVMDLNSTTGTRLNGEQISHESVGNGDVITFGSIDVIIYLGNDETVLPTSR